VIGVQKRSFGFGLPLTMVTSPRPVAAAMTAAARLSNCPLAISFALAAPNAGAGIGWKSIQRPSDRRSSSPSVGAKRRRR
jgi:hypothetical protein